MVAAIITSTMVKACLPGSPGPADGLEPQKITGGSITQRQGLATKSRKRKPESRTFDHWSPLKGAAGQKAEIYKRAS
jgi:hypothetical protein